MTIKENYYHRYGLGRTCSPLIATPAIAKAPVADVLLPDTTTPTAAMTGIIPTCPESPVDWGFSSRPEEAEAYWPC